MDPVSAVGVAAAALQFLDASIKTYNVFREIKSSAESATERNKQLEDNLQSVQSLRNNSLAPAPAPQGPIDPLYKLTAKCTAEADELIGLLKYVRGSGEDISSIRATFRAARKEKRIKELHSFLKEDQNALNQMIFEKLLPSINLLTVLQSNEFANINSIGQNLIKEQIEQRKIQEDHHAIVAGKLDSIQHNMQLRNDTDDQARVRKELLKSLWFSEIDQRRNEIKEAAPRTLDWLFGSTKSERDSNVDSDYESDFESGSDSDLDWESDSDLSSKWDPTPDVEWSSFREWLLEDSSIYWISGKAGSGKSTLMAHIVNDRRTVEALGTWSSGYKLGVLSFFFWRAGSSLQNSVLGLLRGLLYQLCVLQPAIADRISNSLSPFTGIPTWTEKSLLSTITKAIQFSDGFRFCIFIDGLDEYIGRYDDLVDCIEKLQGFGSVKSCVSSRPELELLTRLQGTKQLRLQDLNWGDIEKVVRKALAKTHLSKKQCTSLTSSVVRRADGVFLWASLVTQSLVKGSKAGDDKEIMQKRLESLPSGMDQLFERMLSEVEPVYRASLEFYVQLMIMTSSGGLVVEDARCIAIITTSLLTKEVNSYDEFSEECERTKTQITTRSAGLLEIFDRYPEYGGRMSRHRGNGSDMLLYEKQRMRWIHRSAFEFLSNQKILPVGLSSNGEGVFRRISEGFIRYIRYIRAAPSTNTQGGSGTLKSTATRINILLHFIARWYDSYPKTASALLDKLYSIREEFDPDELVFYYRFGPKPPLEALGHGVFWPHCAQSGLWSYMYSRTHHIVRGTGCEPLIANTLFSLIYGWYLDDVKYIQTTDFVPLVESLARSLCQRIAQTLRIGGVARPTKWKWIPLHSPFYLEISFSCATWKEPAVSGSVEVMADLLNILGVKPERDKPHPLQGSAIFSALMDVTDLYIALKLGLPRIYIQLSGKAYIMAGIRTHDDPGLLRGRLRATQLDKAVRIRCVPSVKDPYEEPNPSLEHVQFVTLQPSTAASDQLLKLIRFNVSNNIIEFRMAENTRGYREKLCEMLLEEIKSAEQNLDGGQQLIAAACIKFGLLYLDPDDDEISEDGSSV